MRVIDLMAKTAAVATRAGEGNDTSSAPPLRVRRISNEIIDHGVGCDDIDVHPKRIACRLPDPELNARRIAELKKPFVMAGCRGRRQVN